MQARRLRQILIATSLIGGALVAFQNCAPFHASQLTGTGTTASSVSGVVTTPNPAASVPVTVPAPAQPAPGPTPAPAPAVTESLCGMANFNFCDGFESEKLSPVWAQSVTPEDMHRSTTVKYRGASSLQILTKYRSQLNVQKGLPFPGGVLYGRVFVNVKSLPPADDFPNINFIDGTREGYSGSELRIAFSGFDKNKTFDFSVGSDGGPSGDWGFSDSVAADGSSPQFAADTWHCLEWMMDTKKSMMKVWVNGTERTGLAFDSTSPAKKTSGFHSPIVFNEIGNIAIGYRDYHVTNFQSEFFLDEVVIAPTKVGCAN